MKFDRDMFFDGYKDAFGILTQSKKDGLEELLKSIEDDPEVQDIRWAAYMLATVKHECADQWQPIEEYGKGIGRSYGEKIEIIGSDGKTYYNAFYGRGYVQLTWKDNYERMGEALGFGDKFLTHPQLVLQSEIAYKIMSLGMRKGFFTGKKLEDYINDDLSDYKNARRIICGLDRWRLIKSYALALEEILEDSQNFIDSESSGHIGKTEENVKIVKAEKAYFYNEPEEKSKTDSYIIKGDKVIVADPNFVFIRFEGTKTFEKWVKREDLED